jgi:3-hydroxyacyl-[acyl-carrier-protein] dehydratase
VNREQIEALLPHRAPMLLVDRVLELEPGHRIVAEYDVDGDAPWFAGHFPNNPILPGVLVTEALAQAAGVLYMSDNNSDAGSTVYLLGMDKMRFRRPVRPGETLRLEVTLGRNRRRMAFFDVEARVGEERVANGSLLATIAEES